MFSQHSLLGNKTPNPCKVFTEEVQYFLLLVFTDTCSTRILRSSLWLLLPSVVALVRI